MNVCFFGVEVFVERGPDYAVVVDSDAELLGKRIQVRAVSILYIESILSVPALISQY